MIELKRFSQEASLLNPEKIEYFLIFDKHGSELRLPVPKETVDALITSIYTTQSSAVVSPDDGDEEVESEATLGATEFGEEGGFRGNFAEVSEEYGEEEIEGPDSEDEVPSL